MCPRHGATTAAPPAAAPAPRELERITRALARRGYRIQRLLGEGGFGSVHEVSTPDGARAALKLALPSATARESLAREHAALQRVEPPHAPQLLAHGEVAGRPYLVLELVTAPTLAEVLVTQAGPMPLARFGPLARAILHSIDAIHARGFSHRDLKPENIFVRDRENVTVIDFGLAHEEQTPAVIDATAEGAGTPEYMSPEQCSGLSDADPRSDIYSIGSLFFEMLSGAPPFWGKPAEVRESQRSVRPPALMAKVRCSRELDALVRRCLAKERIRRFASVAELAAELEQALGARVRSLPPAAAGRTEAGAATSEHASASQPAREKRTVGLVFFESRRGVANVQSLIVSCGGQLVQTTGVQYVAAFGHELGDNPAQVALNAAQRLWRAQLSERLMVDVATVSVQRRPDGSRRFFSSAFTRRDRFPSSTDPVGVMLTGAACEVLDDLRIVDLGRTDVWLVDLAESEPDTSMHGIRSTSVIGRGTWLRKLGASAQRAHADSLPTVVTIVGEAGHGKSHLASALAQQLAQLAPAACFVRLRARDGIGSPAHTLTQLLRRVLDLPAAAPEDGGRALLLERLGEEVAEQVWTAAALMLGWIDASHPGVSRLAAAPGALRSAAARVAGEALRRRASREPVLLLLDDADRADEFTLDAIEYATLTEAGARLWVAVFVRPSFERSRPAWGTRAGCSEQLVLHALDERDAADLARHLLRPVEYVPPLVLAKLTERTHGIPLLMVELIRGLKREGFVRASERGTGYYLATEALDDVPDLPIVQWSASREVDALPRQLAGHARLASVLGASFTLVELDSLLQILERDETLHDTQLDAGVGVQRLVDAGVLIRHRGDAFDFRHALLRDTIYQMVPEPQRKRLHAAAFEMYLAHEAPSQQAQAKLALHAARAGHATVAAANYLALARHAAATHAYLEAEAAFGAALENLALTEARQIVESFRGRGLMRFRLGRHEDALKDLRRARELSASDVLSTMQLLADEATVLDWTREYAESAALVRKIEAAGVPAGSLLAAQLSMGLSRIYHRAGNAEASVELGLRAAEQARALGDAGYETRAIALSMAASDLANLGRLDEAEACFDSVIAEARAHGDLLHLGGAHSNRALLWFARKDAERTFQDLTSSNRIARELGYPLLEYINTCNLAEVRYALAELDAASEQARRSIDLAKQIWGEASLELGTRELLLARIALYREDFAAVRSLLASIRERMAAERPSDAAHIALLPSELVLLEMVELAAAPFEPSAWDAFVARARAVELQPMEEVELLECRALCALRAGMAAQSRDYFREAIALSNAKPNLLSERVARKLEHIGQSSL